MKETSGISLSKKTRYYHDVPTKSTPLGVILTIAATGSEASNSCVITKADENLKRFCDNDINRAQICH